MYRIVFFRMALRVPWKFACQVFLKMQSNFYGIYLNYLLFHFSLAVGRARGGAADCGALFLLGYPHVFPVGFICYAVWMCWAFPTAFNWYVFSLRFLLQQVTNFWRPWNRRYALHYCVPAFLPTSTTCCHLAVGKCRLVTTLYNSHSNVPLLALRHGAALLR